MHKRTSLRRFFLSVVAILAALRAGATPSRAPVAVTTAPEIETGFRLLYQLKFPEARERFAAWEKAHPDDPLGSASEAASYLFEEFYRHGVLTSEFFLDDKRLLGGIKGKPDEGHRTAFNAANQRAQKLARRRLHANPKDADALFALTISTGMQADYAGLIEKRQFESLRLVREAEGYAKNLLAIAPDSADAYLALGAANYIISCLPGYKRFFLFFGGIHGDKAGGMKQLDMCATHGHYLRPFAKILLALAALREKQVDLARTQLRELNAEFPQNPLFQRELAKLQKPGATATSP
jgi:hypothetical protein